MNHINLQINIDDKEIINFNKINQTTQLQFPFNNITYYINKSPRIILSQNKLQLTTSFNNYILDSDNTNFLSVLNNSQINSIFLKIIEYLFNNISFKHKKGVIDKYEKLIIPFTKINITYNEEYFVITYYKDNIYKINYKSKNSLINNSSSIIKSKVNVNDKEISLNSYIIFNSYEIQINNNKSMIYEPIGTKIINLLLNHNLFNQEIDKIKKEKNKNELNYQIQLNEKTEELNNLYKQIKKTENYDKMQNDIIKQFTTMISNMKNEYEKRINNIDNIDEISEYINNKQDNLEISTLIEHNKKLIHVISNKNYEIEQLKKNTALNKNNNINQDVSNNNNNNLSEITKQLNYLIEQQKLSQSNQIQNDLTLIKSEIINLKKSQLDIKNTYTNTPTKLSNLQDNKLTNNLKLINEYYLSLIKIFIKFINSLLTLLNIENSDKIINKNNNTINITDNNLFSKNIDYYTQCTNQLILSINDILSKYNKLFNIGNNDYDYDDEINIPKCILLNIFTYTKTIMQCNDNLIQYFNDLEQIIQKNNLSSSIYEQIKDIIDKIHITINTYEVDKNILNMMLEQFNIQDDLDINDYDDEEEKEYNSDIKINNSIYIKPINMENTISESNIQEQNNNKQSAINNKQNNNTTNKLTFLNGLINSYNNK